MAIASSPRRRYARSNDHSRPRWTLVAGDDSAFLCRDIARNHMTALCLMREGIASGDRDHPDALPGLVVVEDGFYSCVDRLPESMRR